MPFNKKSKPKVIRTQAELQEPRPRAVTYFDTFTPAPAPVGVEVRERLVTGITLVKMKNGLWYREDCGHWVTNMNAPEPTCRHECPSPVDRMRGVL